MNGITFSLAMDCRTRGVPYIAARQLDIEETYRPARRRKPVHVHTGHKNAAIHRLQSTI
jgi:hypothetical protein